jgi:iron complex outermembrane receptor protein
VDNGVSRAGVANILSLCYNDAQFRNGGGYCNLVTRNASTGALTVNNSYINLATDIVRGYEYNLRYSNDIGTGKLSVEAMATNYTQQANKLFAADPLDDTNGTIGTPKWSGALDVKYTVKGWTVYYGMEWVGKTSSYEYLGEDAATSTYKFDTPNYFLHSVSLKYADSVGKWSVTGGVRNVADKNPPSISAGYYNRVGNAALYSGYDMLGRTFFMNFSKSF